MVTFGQRLPVTLRWPGPCDPGSPRHRSLGGRTDSHDPMDQRRDECDGQRVDERLTGRSLGCRRWRPETWRRRHRPQSSSLFSNTHFPGNLCFYFFRKSFETSRKTVGPCPYIASLQSYERGRCLPKTKFLPVLTVAKIRKYRYPTTMVIPVNRQIVMPSIKVIDQSPASPV